MMKFIHVLMSVAHAKSVMYESQRKMEQRLALNESKIARENNAIVLQDLKIESEKLKIEELEKRIHPLRFNPDDEDEFPR